MDCSASARLTDSLASQACSLCRPWQYWTCRSGSLAALWADKKQLTPRMETVAKAWGTLPEWPLSSEKCGHRLSPLHESR